VVSVLASRFSRYVPLLDVMNRRPRYPERARTILVIGDRRHSAQALPKSRILFLRLCNYLSPFNAHIPPINRISSHSLTTLALVELASTATGRQVLHEVDTIISPSSTIQTNDGSYSSFFACCNKKDRLLPLDLSSLRMSAADMAPVASRTWQGYERMSREVHGLLQSRPRHSLPYTRNGR
jgi:hypothetical protein